VVTPYIDGVAKETMNATLAAFGASELVIGVKAGPTAAAETLIVDYVKCVQLR
jgi:hypothetical protein